MVSIAQVEALLSKSDGDQFNPWCPFSSLSMVERWPLLLVGFRNPVQNW